MHVVFCLYDDGFRLSLDGLIIDIPTQTHLFEVSITRRRWLTWALHFLFLVPDLMLSVPHHTGVDRGHGLGSTNYDDQDHV